MKDKTKNKGLESMFENLTDDLKEKVIEAEEYKTVDLEKSELERSQEWDVYLVPLREGLASVKINAEEFVIGGDGTSFNFHEIDSTVSRLHAKIIDNNKGLFVEDLKSLNGTKIYRANDDVDNGVEVISCLPNTRVPLMLGDEIAFGGMVCKLMDF